MKIFEYKLKVEENLLDNYGHVNNARYLDIYEKARWNVFEQSKEGKEILKQKVTGIIILEVSIKFKSEIISQEEISIETYCENKGDRIFIIYQKIVNDAGVLKSTAIFKAALFNLDTRKLVKADSTWLRALGEA